MTDARLDSTGPRSELKLMLAELAADDAGVRRRAATALGLLRDEAAVPALIAALSDASPRVAEEAAEALGSIRDTRSLSPLVRALGHPNASARVGAVKALAALRDKSSVGALISVLARDSDWLCRRHAATALGEIGDPVAATALLAALGDPDAHNRTFVVEALGKLRVTESAEKIVAMLDNFRSAEVAIDALVLIGEPSVAAILSSLHRLEKHSGWRNAFQALGRLGPYAVEPLIERLGDADPEVRALAAQALGEIGDARAATALSALLRDGPAVRNAAAAALARIGVDGARILLAATKQGDEDTRESAVAALFHLGTSATAALIEALETGTPRIRAAAIAGLARIGPLPSHSLSARALRDPHATVRAAAVQALQGEDGSAVRGIIIELLSDGDSGVREVAARASGKRGNADAVEHLIRLLQDSDSDVASAAAIALGEIGDKRAITALTAPLRPNDPAFQRTLSEALRRLGVIQEIAFSDFEVRHRRHVQAADALCVRDRTVIEPSFRRANEPLRIEAGDDVSLGAAAPAACARGRKFIAHFAAYPPTQEAAVRGLLQSQSPDASQLLGKRSCRWEAGTDVTVTLRAEGFEVTPPRQNFIWNTRVETLDFMVNATETATEHSVLEFAVSIYEFTVALVYLNVRVGERVASETVQASTAPARTAFASYASGDRPLVMHMVGAIERSAGLDVFLDCLDLKASEIWKSRLVLEIAARDQFLLFWSRRARASPWVEWEWKQALHGKGKGALQLHPLEADVPPPPALEHLHTGSIHALVAQYYSKQPWWRRAWRAFKGGKA
jgi:HEAT repeat protein